MPPLRVETAHLLPEVRQGLVAVLRDLDATDWDAPTVCGSWTVHDLASHLLGVDLGFLSTRRDGRWGGPAVGQPLGEWLDAFNGEWVTGARRLSPTVLVDLIEMVGPWFDDTVKALDLDAEG